MSFFLGFLFLCSIFYVSFLKPRLLYFKLEAPHRISRCFRIAVSCHRRVDSKGG